jgi:hypothetical protein
LVGQAEQLGEHEGLSSFWSKASQGIGHSDLLPDVVYHLAMNRKSGFQRGIATTVASPCSQLVGARVAGDSQEPRPS